MSNKRRVIILGFGFSGQLAAHVCHAHFDEVIVIENSLFRSEDKTRVPQAHHLHVLLKNGQRILEKLVPIVFKKIIACGAVSVDWSSETAWDGPFGEYPRKEKAFTTYLFSRQILDILLYEHVINLPKVKILQASVTDVRLSDCKSVIKSITMGDKSIDTSAADLIIECRGRNAEVEEWLIKNDLPKPKSEHVENTLMYASQTFSLDAPLSNAFKQGYIQVRSGKRDSGVVISPIENNRIIMTYITEKRKIDFSKNDLRVFLNGIKSTLSFPSLQKAQPVSNIKTFKELSNARYFFEKYNHLPNNCIVIGDALCKLNPVYGQGMTVICNQMALLQKMLQKPIPFHSKQFQKKVSRTLWMPWLISSSEDQRKLSSDQLSYKTRLLHYCVDYFYLQSTQYPKMHYYFLCLLHMINPFSRSYKND